MKRFRVTENDLEFHVELDPVSLSRSEPDRTRVPG